MSEVKIKAWDGDLLDRQRDGDFLIKLILAKQADAKRLRQPFSFVLNLDADWGYGKSFLLEHLGLSLKEQGHLVAKVDAWGSDFAVDPLLPVMAAIEESIKPMLETTEKRSKWEAVKGNAGSIVLAAGTGLARGAINRLLPGTAEAVSQIMNAGIDETAASVVDDGLAEGAKRALDTLLDAFAKEALDDHRRAAGSIQQFRNDLKDILEDASGDIPLPLFVMVDELDRCRPSYAVSLLERIKHLFDIPNVVFIVATNTTQLMHSIGAVYGAGFDGGRYLHRFFDLTFTLGEPNRASFVATELMLYPSLQANGNALPGTSLSEYLVAVFRALDMSARDMRQSISLLNTLVSIWPPESRPFWGVLIPLVCAHQLKLDRGTMDAAWQSLQQRLKHDDWSFYVSDGEGNEIIPVFGVLERTSKLVDSGFQALNTMSPPFGITSYIHDSLFKDVRRRRFGVEDYSSRIAQAGQLKVQDT